MCAIAGIVSGRIDRGLLKRMTASLTHRGPDGEGLWLDEGAGIGLGHRRLAILDLSPAGHQPMVSRDGRYVLTFNGEIYNHLELRARLGAETGIVWRSRCDAETLVEAIARWGLRRTLERCVGMFALGLWDRRERQLQLARDRFGEKPLYYGKIGDELLFASELGAIGLHRGLDREVDRTALAELAARGYIPAPRSIFAGVNKLEPASILTVDAADPGAPAILGIERYWSYREVVRAGLDRPFANEAQALEALEAALADAVTGQSVADVDVGLFLSGGIDSSTIVALHRRHSSADLRTYAVGFEAAAYDEAPFARAVAAHFETDHHEWRVSAAEARAMIPQLGAIYGEPFADPAAIPTLLISRLARENVTVALAGDGGDELFGGYTRYRTAADLWAGLRRVPRALRRGVGRALEAVPPRAWDGVARLSSRADGADFLGARLQRTFFRFHSVDGFDDLYRSFRDEWTGRLSPVLGIAEAAGTRDFDLHDDDVPDVARMMYCDAVSYLPGAILCKVDRASMACGLETRLPFLDHRVAEVAARIGQSMKVQASTGKVILRKLLHRHAPAALFDRPKAGFSVPIGAWLRGPLRPWAEDLLDGERLRRDGYFDAALVHRCWREHLDRRRDASMALWAILMFQSWQLQRAPLC